jgi:hypothetical protein
MLDRRARRSVSKRYHCRWGLGQHCHSASQLFNTVLLNPYESPTQPNVSVETGTNNLRRGIRHGIGMAVLGTIAVVVIIVAIDMLPSVLDGYMSFSPYLTVGFWKLYGFPLLLFVPLATFLAGVASTSPAKRFGYARTLGVICFFALPVSAVLANLGMSPPRYRSIQHPPMYWTEVVMFVVPFVAVSAILTLQRWRQVNEQQEVV